MSITPHQSKNRTLPTPRHWWIRYYPLGKKGGVVAVPFEGSEAEARAYDLALRKQTRKTPPGVNPQFTTILPDFVNHYRLERQPRTVETLVQRLPHLSAFFGRLPLAAITLSLIEEYKRQRVQSVKPITVNKELNNLSTILQYAVDHDLLAEKPRIKLFPGKLTKSPVPVMPTGDEMARLVAEIRPESRGPALLMFYAGLRRNEALRLKAEDVLLERGLLLIEGKGGKQRIVPLTHPPLIAELKQRLAIIPTGYLWLNPRTKRPYRTILAAMKAAAKRIGLSSRVYHHLLRHGFGTTAIESGIDLRSVQGLMGHSTSRTTELYTHLAAVHLKSQMEKFSTGISTVKTK